MHETPPDSFPPGFAVHRIRRHAAFLLYNVLGNLLLVANMQITRLPRSRGSENRCLPYFIINFEALEQVNAEQLLAKCAGKQLAASR